jgi:uncharacterized integral membrane protein
MWLQVAIFVLLLVLFIDFSWRVAMVHGDFVGGSYHMPGADFTNIYAAGLLARGGHVALTLLLSLYVTPYGFSSDMVGYTLVLVILAAQNGWRVSLVDGLFWLWPGFIVLGTALTGIILTPLVVGVAAFRAWQAARPA